MRSSVAVLVLAATSVIVGGCAKARMVEVAQDGGVVAIPANSNRWPNYYRNQAEELIREKCPDGYEIVEEEEVVVGQVARTNSQTKTKKAPKFDLGGLRKDADDREDREDGSASFAGLTIPLGRDEAETHETTNYSDVTEYRIRYRPKQP